MNKQAIKRFLAWVAIILIVAVFLYFSWQSYRLLTGRSETIDNTVITAESQTEAASGSRTNWAEVVGLLIVGALLIYAIKKTNRQIDQNTTVSDEQTTTRANDNTAQN